MTATVRVTFIKLTDFKNTNHGTLELIAENQVNMCDASNVIGIYGQNGSGKTAIIQALGLLKHLLMGMPIPEDFKSCVQVGKASCTIEYGLFIVDDDGEEYKVNYVVDLGVRTMVAQHTTDGTQRFSESEVPSVLRETIKVAQLGLHSKPLQEMISYDIQSQYTFTPKTKLETFTGNSKSALARLAALKQLAIERSQSFIFSRETLDVLYAHNEAPSYNKVLKALEHFGLFNLFVIDTKSAGRISMNAAFTMNYRFDQGTNTLVGQFTIPFTRPTQITESELALVEHYFDNLNEVLTELIPGLMVRVHKIGESLNNQNETVYTIELLSVRDDKTIPFRYESEGIQKICTVLNVLIRMHNSSSTTVAIDELDSGIFEYLLGELLSILAESGKGQLVFTSHNLRPLEMLDKNHLRFTTTDPDNRYVKIKHVQANNNLRDFYYRDIVVGLQKDSLYEATNSIKISRALKRAGQYDDANPDYSSHC